jgi:hypothetical protein
MVALAASATIAACGGGNAHGNNAATVMPAIPVPLVPSPVPSFTGMPGVAPPSATPRPTTSPSALPSMR